MRSQRVETRSLCANTYGLNFNLPVNGRLMFDDNIQLYDYSLPNELIAQIPAERRDASRLLVLDRKSGAVEHQLFVDLPSYLRHNDLLVVNNTRVVPAKLKGVRTATNGKWEGLFLREEPDHHWRLIGHTRGSLQAGETLTIVPADKKQSAAELILKLVKRDFGEWIAQPQSDEPTLELLAKFGTMPLPPYMERDTEATDWDRYQTTFAKHAGAVAAPTAGLHFTPELLKRCEELGVNQAAVTLHVGIGTFRPVNVDRLSDHNMHHEWCELPVETVQAISDTKAKGGRVIAVGTTTVRTLESVCAAGPLRPWKGETNLFITPPWNFQVVDGLITNFHLPKSTLLVLVSAFSTRENILNAYHSAIAEEYRFFSYGDAMLII